MKQSVQAPVNLLENLRKVITLVDQLRDIGLSDYIKLPRIVVLGIQSSGKSSLLEQIVGIDFLPRGDGVVTRRPLELRLSYVPQSQCPVPYAIFEEIKGVKFTDFTKVKESIIELTDRVAGSSKNIVDKPIIMSVHGPNCPDLTLVDLPGITRIPIAGQDKDIEQVTKEMARRYCEDPKTIILCVVAANQDLSTSDALQMAMKLDPQGTRTFGVLTKIDIMDKGTNALKMLRGQDVALKLGYVGVKLRSQKDIQENITVQKALESERQFFASHPVYASIPGDLFGTAVLTTKLTNILYRHIRSFLPELMKEINKRASAIDERLTKLGPGLPTEDKEKLHYIWQIINSFSIRFKNSISGSYEKSSLTTGKAKPPAGSKIRALFADLLRDQEKVNYKALLGLKEDHIQQVIYKYEGDNIPGFLSVDAFYALLDPELRKVKEPISDCVSETYSILEEYAVDILDQQLEKQMTININRLPAVKDLVKEQVLNVIQTARDKAEEAVGELLDSEINYIFTNDIDFLTGQQTQQQSTEKSEDKNPLVAQLRKKIEHYYKLVIRLVRDNVPKLIGHFLVKGCQNSMLLSLQENIMQNQEYLNIINEPVAIAEERQRLKGELETLKAAQKIVKRDPDLSDYILKLQNQEQENDQKIQQDDDAPEDDQEQQVSTAQQSQIQVRQQQPQQQQQKPTLFDRFKSNGNDSSQQPQTQPQPQTTHQPSTTQQPSQPQPQQQNQTPPPTQPTTQPPPEEKKASVLKSQLYKVLDRYPQAQQKPQVEQPKKTLFDPMSNKPSPAAQGANDPLKQQQGPKKTLQDQYNAGVDKAVDKAMEDPRTQEALKSGARSAAASAVDAKMPGAPQWVKNGAQNAAEAAITSNAAQNAIKVQNPIKYEDQAKSQLKDPMGANEEKPAANKGLFGFLGGGNKK